jgi:hypothetical protein
LVLVSPGTCSGCHCLDLSLAQEFNIISEIKLLQSACNNYDIDPHEHFGTWFHGMERLSEAQR